jgi:alpha-beta hydrolase superfamily lysophospholipase
MGGRRGGRRVLTTPALLLGLALVAALCAACRDDPGTASRSTVPASATVPVPPTGPTGTDPPDGPTATSGRSDDEASPDTPSREGNDIGTSPPDASGEVVSAEPLTVPDVDGLVWRVTYRSRRIDGKGVNVTGVVVRPTGPAPPGGFPVIAWGHGTTGVADACVPMNSFDGHLGIPALQEHLDAGFVVAATDYEGIGGPGTHPYLVAESEARSVLDMVRTLPLIDGVDASGATVLAGHSQGGHAVLAAAERRARLAPDLQIVGVAALASGGDLWATVPAMFRRRSLAEFAVLLAVGWADTYPDLEVEDVVGPAGTDAVAAARSRACLNELQPYLGGTTMDELFVANPAELDAWAARIDENDLEADRINLPVFVAGGGADRLVVPSLVDGLVERLCGAGLAVDLHRYPDAGHGATVDASVPDLHRWTRDRMAGEPVPSSCGDDG